MEKYLSSHSTSQLAKDKGFDAEVNFSYFRDLGYNRPSSNYHKFPFNSNLGEDLSRPLLCQLRDWLRSKKSINIDTFSVRNPSVPGIWIHGYHIDVMDLPRVTIDGFATPEGALESAVTLSLKQLPECVVRK